MNNARRAKLTITRALIEQARDIVARAACEEREYFDDKLPEIVLGDRAQTADATATALDKAADSLEEVLTALDVMDLDPVGELDRLYRAAELSDVPPVAQG